jgi:hypothetical protein
MWLEIDMADGENDKDEVVDVDIESNVGCDWDHELAEFNCRLQTPWLGIIGLFTGVLSVVLACFFSSLAVLLIGLGFSVLFFGLNSVLEKLVDIEEQIRQK